MIRKKVLITGGTGFLGQCLQAKLVSRGADVFAIGSKHCDLRLPDQVDDLFNYLPFKPDYIFHLAANVGGIQVTSKFPATSFYDNMMMGTLMIDRAHKHAPDAKFIMAGSVCAYPKYTPVPFTEENLWTGYPEDSNGSYGVAKRALSTCLDAYRKQYGMKSVYALMTNLYGPCDDFSPETSHVIPALIKRFVLASQEGDEKVTVWGTGLASRDFLYVEDAAEALIALAERYESDAPINVGSGKEISIAGLSAVIKVLTSFDGRIEYDPSKPDGQPRRCLNINKIKRSTGWTPATSITDGIAKTIAWWNKQYITSPTLASEKESIEVTE